MDVSCSTSIHRWIVSGILLALLKAAIDKVSLLRATFAKIKDCPGRQMLWLDPYDTAALILGPIFPRPGMGGYVGAKFSFYKEFRATSFASVKFSTAQPLFWIADAEAIKIITSDRHTFQKDVVPYKPVNIYGGSLLTSEGSDWKRHRSVVMSAFNEENIALVWAETMRVVSEWFEKLDTAGPNIPMDMAQSMAEVTLPIITSAGFGKRLSLTTDLSAELPPGYRLSFQSAVMNSVSNVVFRAIVPKWFYQLPWPIKVPYLSSRALLTQLAFDELRNHMHDLVASARTEIMSGGGSGVAALLRNLVEANTIQDVNSKGLTDAELLSNIFTFLLAGHETSAHTLSFAFVLLALSPECQQKLYEEVICVWPGDVVVKQSTTTYKDDTDKLQYTLACLRETLRMCPVVPRMPRIVHTDTTLPGTCFIPGTKDTPSIETGKFSMAIPSGSTITVDIWAMHMNPLYWGEDVAEFRPERFIDTKSYRWPRDAFLPFFGGPRSCIGQRFAIAEMIGIIARVVRRYRILVPDDLVKKPFEQRKEALLAWTTGVTATPLNARVKLSRRI